MTDRLGQRMKEYEHQFTSLKLDSHFPVIARIDGRSFSKFTKGMDHPFDEDMLWCMQSTTKYLMEETHAINAFCQSDEITLVWYNPDEKSEFLFGGKVSKLNSVLASMASVYFNMVVKAKFNEISARDGVKKLMWQKKTDMLPVFDCRIWNVPNLTEASNTILWRELDAIKNSISMTAQSNFSHKELQGKHQDDMLEMLYDKGVIWNDISQYFRKGTHFKRESIKRKFTPDELNSLPEEHEGKKNPDAEIIRTVTRIMNDWPPLIQLTGLIREKKLFGE